MTTIRMNSISVFDAIDISIMENEKPLDQK